MDGWKAGIEFDWPDKNDQAPGETGDPLYPHEPTTTPITDTKTPRLCPATPSYFWHYSAYGDMLVHLNVQQTHVITLVAFNPDAVPDCGPPQNPLVSLLS